MMARFLLAEPTVVGAPGKKPFTVERVRWNGKVPFETKTMEALPDGFRLTFTEPADH